MSDLTAATIEYRACWKSPSAAQLDVRRVTDYDDEHLTMFWEWVADCATQVPERIYWVEARTVTDWTTDLAAPRDQTDDGLAERVGALLPPCYITRNEVMPCTDWIGSKFGNGVWLEAMCCLPCLIRRALADQPDTTASEEDQR